MPNTPAQRSKDVEETQLSTPIKMRLINESDGRQYHKICCGKWAGHDGNQIKAINVVIIARQLRNWLADLTLVWSIELELRISSDYSAYSNK